MHFPFICFFLFIFRHAQILTKKKSKNEKSIKQTNHETKNIKYRYLRHRKRHLQQQQHKKSKIHLKIIFQMQ